MTQGRHQPSQALSRPEEHGTVLVLFALLFVGIFGLLGAVVDGGRLRVTRQQMDAGAECAALEGVRFRDTEGDAGRRLRAIRGAELLYDDDMDPANGDALGLGAGTLPVVSGDTPLRGTINVATDPANRVWKPADALETNSSNSQHGDLVAGTHVLGGFATEDDTFKRDDFAPSPPGSSAASLTSAPAFLVRLRRANDRLDLDRDPSASSAGPPFEWLWARGAVWHEPTAGQSNQSRAEGLTLRATSIASSERALVLSNDPTGGVLLTNFVLRADAGSAWDATPLSGSITLKVESNGLLTVAGIEEGAITADAKRLVGAEVLPSLSTWSTPPAASLIVPVYTQIAGTRLIVGFTRANATLSGATLTVTRLPGSMLPTSASTISPAALDSRIALETVPALRNLYSTFQHPVLAPVLRR